VKFSLDSSHDYGAIQRGAAGQITFVPNRKVQVGYYSVRAPSNYGTYSIDFSPVGFNLPTASVPTAVAWPVPGDSVEILLGVDADESIVMNGGWNGDTLSGTWYLRLPRGARAGGSFIAISSGSQQKDR
jgi:hypothetical protein